LYTSDIDLKREKKRRVKAAAVYFLLACLCVLFDRVYARFGHGVESASMLLMFLYPLLGGALPFLVMLTGRARTARGGRVWFNLWNSGIAVLTVRSALKGVFDIAGTSSPYLGIYLVAGIALCASAAGGYFLRVPPGKTNG